MKNTEQKIPALRFPEFEGEWVEKRLGEIARITTGTSNRIDSILDGEYAFFDRSQEIRTSNIYLFDGEAIIMAGEGQEFIPKYFIGKFDLHQRAYAIMNLVDVHGLYVYYYIFENRNYFSRYAVGSTVKSLRLDTFEKMRVKLPCLDEQHQIADFLSAVDKRLQSLKEKKTKLEEYKQGVMQRIFSEELRFTRPDGSAYPDWEEKRLGEVAKLQGGFAFKSELFKTEGIPIIRISNISPENRIDIDNLVYYDKFDNDDRYLLNRGDLIIALSGATTGKSCVYNLDHISYLNQRVGVFRKRDKELYYNFLVQFVFSWLFIKELNAVLVAGAQPNISPSDIELFELNIPCYDEQHQIADFLSSIDDKIALLTKQIQSTEQYKKGLLQQLFV